MDPITLITPESTLAKQKADLKTQQRQQQAVLRGEEKGEEITANRDKAYKVKKHEAHLIHVFVNTKTVALDQKSLHEEKRILKISDRNIQQMIENGAFAAYDEARIIHDPRKNAPEKSLKPVVQMPPPLPGSAQADADAALAAREQKARDREKAAEERERAVEAKLARMEELAAKLDQKPANQKTKTEDKGEKLPPLPDQQ